MTTFFPAAIFFMRKLFSSVLQAMSNLGVACNTLETPCFLRKQHERCRADRDTQGCAHCGELCYNRKQRTMRHFLLILLVLMLLAPSHADGPVAPREVPPALASIPQTETHRIRLVNSVDGAIQVSLDKGQTWHLVGRVTAPATESLPGYLASGYAQVGTVAATAVHGLRIRVGDTAHAYASLVNILPREFASTPVRFGGHVSGLSGIYTSIPTGTGIFRNLAPYAGNVVYLEAGDGRVANLPVNYMPQEGDTLIIVVERPVNALREIVFENRVGGNVTATFANGRQSLVTHVLKPVTGIGRFDGTSYTGVGAINTNHSGVVTISTAPVTTSTLLEGVGDERRGGFQIEPAYHNSQTDEAGAPSILVVGSPDKKRMPDQEGTPPLFHGNISLAWDAADPQHSWVAQIRRGDTASPWLPMPALLGNQPNALAGVTAIRLVQQDAGDTQWRMARLAEASRQYQASALALARSGKTRIVRGQITLSAVSSDRRTSFAEFFVDGAFKAMSNTRPFSFAWDTHDVPDGEYVVETRAEDEQSHLLLSSHTKIWVDNAQKLMSRLP